MEAKTSFSVEWTAKDGTPLRHMVTISRDPRSLSSEEAAAAVKSLVRFMEDRENVALEPPHGTG